MNHLLVTQTASGAVETSLAKRTQQDGEAFSLTPALSRWEREPVSPTIEISRATGGREPHQFSATPCGFPRPAGEGSRVRENACLVPSPLDMARRLCKTIFAHLRFSIRQPPVILVTRKFGGALPNAIRRYSRLKICATTEANS